MEDLKEMKVKNWKEITKDRRSGRNLVEKAKPHKWLKCEMMMMMMMMITVPRTVRLSVNRDTKNRTAIVRKFQYGPGIFFFTSTQKLPEQNFLTFYRSVNTNISMNPQFRTKAVVLLFI